MPSSWQNPIRSAFTPVVSASVSSVMLPMPISISAAGWRARTGRSGRGSAANPELIGSMTGSTM